MQRIGLIINLEKPQAVEVTRELLAWFENRRVTVKMPHHNARALGKEELGLDEGEVPGQVEVILVLGGDGTLLHAARAVAPNGTPLLGINMGQLGFLTEIEQPDVFAGMEKLMAGQYRIEQRMMLEATIRRGGDVADRFLALNDVVITKGGFSRMINLETYVGRDLIATYPADGLIVSSSTGSTAYSLSAGGPIVSPDVQVMILTPICPHTLNARPVVISPRQRVRVVLRSEFTEAMLTVDGQDGVKLQRDDEISVVRASYSTRLVRLKGGRNFYEVMREKLREGGRDGG
ncbi:inorganic polyphosphate kinase [Clostridiales bacterium PH28_bin88]|nr:inorganic polyphosphate kinase [Clostridiales bacterium PH28_bin88]